MGINNRKVRPYWLGSHFHENACIYKLALLVTNAVCVDVDDLSENAIFITFKSVNNISVAFYYADQDDVSAA